MLNVLNSPIWFVFAQDAPAGEPTGFSSSILLPVAAIGMLFYFMLLRPERQRKAQMSSLMENLKKNDRVVTIGGIHGTVVNVQKESKEVVIRVDENTNTRLRVLRSAIARVVTESENDTEKD